MKWDFVLWHHFLFSSTTLYPFDKQQITKNEVVVDTTKVDIFKQITTSDLRESLYLGLLLIPQR